MSQYGATQNVPYTGQQDRNLVDNPRYQGQAGGTVPQGATGPQQESRYGAAPLSTSGNNDPLDSIRNPAAYGFKKHEPEGFRFPGLQQGQQQQGGQGGYGSNPNAQSTGGYGGNPNPQSGYGSQTTGGQGITHNQQSGYGSQTGSGYGLDPNAQSGYGSQTTGGQGTTDNQLSGYGGQTNSGYGSQPTGGYGADPNVRSTQAGYGGQPTTGGYGADQAGYGPQPTSGFGTNQQQQRDSEFAKDQPGYGQPGFGAPSQGQNTGALWPQPATPPNAHKHDHGQGGYGQQQSGQGPYSGDGTGQQQSGQGPYSGSGYGQQQQQPGQVPYSQAGYGQQQQQSGQSPYTGGGNGQQGGQGYDPNVRHPNETAGFGGGHGHHHHAAEAAGAVGAAGVAAGATGIATGATGHPTGADAYSQSQPQREGIVGHAKDAVGVGPNSGYNARTPTGNDAYVHGNHPVGQQDRLQGVNEPSYLGGEQGVNAPGGRRDGVPSQGGHLPQSALGETRTEPGYDSSKDHLPGHGGHHHNLGDTGRNTGTDTSGIDERRGKGFQDPADSNNSKFGTGTGTETGVGTGTGAGLGTAVGTGSGVGTGTGTGTGSDYQDSYTTSSTPKKGLISKIKDKMHH